MANTPALNVEGPEIETVELETSGVPENFAVPEEVSPSVPEAEEVSRQPIRSPGPQRSRRPPQVFTYYAPGNPMHDAQVNHVNCVSPHMSQTPSIPQYPPRALAPTSL